MKSENTQEFNYGQMYGLVQKAKNIVMDVANSVIPYKINTFNVSYSVKVTQGYSSIPNIVLYIEMKDSIVSNFTKLVGITIAAEAIVGMPAEFLEKGWEYFRESTKRAIKQAVITIVECIVTNNYTLIDKIAEQGA